MEIKVYRNKTTGQLECWPYEILNTEMEFLGCADSKNINFSCSLKFDRENHLQDLLQVAQQMELESKFIESLENDPKIQEEALQKFERNRSNDDGWNYHAESALKEVFKMD